MTSEQPETQGGFGTGLQRALEQRQEPAAEERPATASEEADDAVPQAPEHAATPDVLQEPLTMDQRVAELDEREAEHEAKEARLEARLEIQADKLDLLQQQLEERESARQEGAGSRGLRRPAPG